MCGHVKGGMYISYGENIGCGILLRVYVISICAMYNMCVSLATAFENLTSQIKFSCAKMLFQIYIIYEYMLYIYSHHKIHKYKHFCHLTLCISFRHVK